MKIPPSVYEFVASTSSVFDNRYPDVANTLTVSHSRRPAAYHQSRPNISEHPRQSSSPHFSQEIPCETTATLTTPSPTPWVSMTKSEHAASTNISRISFLPDASSTPRSPVSLTDLRSPAPSTPIISYPHVPSTGGLKTLSIPTSLPQSGVLSSTSASQLQYPPLASSWNWPSQPPAYLTATRSQTSERPSISSDSLVYVPAPTASNSVALSISAPGSSSTPVYVPSSFLSPSSLPSLQSSSSPRISSVSPHSAVTPVLPQPSSSAPASSSTILQSALSTYTPSLPLATFSSPTLPSTGTPSGSSTTVLVSTPTLSVPGSIGPSTFRSTGTQLTSTSLLPSSYPATSLLPIFSVSNAPSAISSSSNSVSSASVGVSTSQTVSPSISFSLRTSYTTQPPRLSSSTATPMTSASSTARTSSVSSSSRTSTARSISVVGSVASIASASRTSSQSSRSTQGTSIPPAPSAAGSSESLSARGKERVWWLAFLIPVLAFA